MISGRSEFESICAQYNTVQNGSSQELVAGLFKLMDNPVEYFPDNQLLFDGVGLAESHLRSLSAINVRLREVLFGSRTKTLILVDREGHVDYIERTMSEPIESVDHDQWIASHLEFRLAGWRDWSNTETAIPQQDQPEGPRPGYFALPPARL